MKNTVRQFAAGLVLALVANLAFAKDRVLIVPTHPDDLAHSLGFCLVATNEFEIHVCDYTHGERGLGPVNFTNGYTKAVRTAEEQRVCDAIGAKLHWLDEIDGTAYAGKETCDRLVRLIVELRPVAVFAHWPIDMHPDHVMSGAATLRAIATASTKDYKPEVYFFFQEYGAKDYQPDVYVDITDVVDRKFELIRYWACQMPKSPDAPYGMPRRKIWTDAFFGMQTAMARMSNSAETFRSMFPRMAGGKPTIFDRLRRSPRDIPRWLGVKDLPADLR